MKIPQSIYKAAKGAVVAAGVAAFGAVKNGVPMNKAGLLIALSAAGGAAFHFLASAIEQGLGYATVKTDTLPPA